jgi:DNA-binding response OmpR family regulator
MVAPGINEAPPERARVVLADADSSLTSRLRLLLFRSDRYLVSIVNDGPQLLKEFAAREFDLLLVDPALPDRGEGGILRKLREAGTLVNVPTIALLHTKRVHPRIDAWHLGVVDCIVWPVSDEELLVRATSALRIGKTREVVRERASDLSGRLTCVAFAEVVSMIASQRRGGVLSISTPRGRAKVLFHDGRIVHATFLGFSGHAAVFALMAEEHGGFEFHSVDIAIEEVSRTVTWNPTALIMEGARLIDEQRAATLYPARAAPEPEEPTVPTDRG